jgi:peptidoglycan/xylan/chitin deacetylase (PgdA/CDA1 family)
MKQTTIVMYHYVRDMDKTDYPDIKGLTVKEFEIQLDYILKNYSVIPLPDYLEFLQNKKDIPDDSCILTFDDGLKDHYQNVFPVLQDRNIPAAFFPITQPLFEFILPVVQKAHFLLAKLGTKKLADEFNQTLKSKFPELFEEFIVNDKNKKEQRFRWDDCLTANLKHSIGALPVKAKTEILNHIFSKHFENEKEFCQKLYLNFEEIKEMIKAGMYFGSHSHTHPMLSRLNFSEQVKEIKNSKELLEKELDIEIKAFSYPYDSFNAETIDILKQEKYICGLTSKVGVNKGKNIDPFKLKRIDTNDVKEKNN